MTPLRVRCTSLGLTGFPHLDYAGLISKWLQKFLSDWVLTEIPTVPPAAIRSKRQPRLIQYELRLRGK